MTGRDSDWIREVRGEVEQPGVAPVISTSPDTEYEGATVGRYELIERIGEGGMGTVWMAEQSDPVSRRVALKVIKLGMDTREVVARFEAERQALARMDHPYIARVYDGGATEQGRPYFVMELVEGVPIQRFCDDHGLTLQHRLELFAKVCEALQHAHQKGIIHRDIKPSNIIVSGNANDPVPKVIDFGVAKATTGELTAKTLLTQSDQILGTPEYMAPEQADPDAFDIDTRADVYSLGIVLYELLTGTRPFEFDTRSPGGRNEALRAIREDDPPTPSTRVSSIGGETSVRIDASRGANSSWLSSRLRGDLDWIVLKALAKDRSRRYETASAFADDIRRHLANEPVAAGPPSRSYRLGKLMRRYRVAVTASLIIVFLLLLGAAGATWAWWNTRAQNRVIQDALQAKEDQRKIASGATEAAQAQLARALEFKDILTSMLGSVEPRVAMGADVELLESLLDQVGDHLASGAVQHTDVAAELHQVVGSTYMGMQQYDMAEYHLERSLEKAREYLGEAHLATGDAIYQLANLEILQGHEERARARIERYLPLARAEHGDHMGVVRFELLHAQLEIRWGDPQLAEQRVREILKRLLARTDAGPAETIFVQDLLAITLMNNGKVDEATPLMEQTVAHSRETLGANHHRTLRAEKNLSLAYSMLGRDADAVALVERAGDAAEKIFGPGYMDTLILQAAYAQTLSEAGRFVEFEKVLREIIDQGTRSLRATHPLVAAAETSLAAHLKDTRRLAEARSSLEAAVAQYTGSQAPPLMLTMTLADMCANQRDFAAVDKLLEQSSEQLARFSASPAELGMLKAHAQMTLRAMTNVAFCMNQARRFAPARSLVEISIPMKEAQLGCEHSWTLNAKRELAIALDGLAEADAATEAWREYFACARVRSEAEPPMTPGELFLVASKFLIPPRPEFLDLAMALELSEAAARGTDYKNPQMLANLAECRIRNGDLPGAAEAIELALPIVADQPGVQQMFQMKLDAVHAQIRAADPSETERIDG